MQRTINRFEPPWLILALALAMGCRGPTAGEPNTRANEGPSLPDLVDRVKGSVVNIDVLTLKPGWKAKAAPKANEVLQAQGSGFFIQDDGLLVTNHHVIEGALAVRVRTQSGESFESSIVGSDKQTDLAVLRVKGAQTKFLAATWADSSKVRIGQTVLAIGNPYGLSLTVTHGIVSAAAREVMAGPYDEFLQTDAAINPGNSGGPLFNLSGEVVGINAANVRNANNIGFAIPSNLAQSLIPQLIQSGRVRRGWLGLTLDDVSPALTEALKIPEPDGALVKVVAAKSPAEKAGFRANDIVLELNEQKILSAGAMRRSLGMLTPETNVRVTIFRAGIRQTLTANLAEHPDDDGPSDTPRAFASEDSEKQRRIGLTLEDGLGKKKEPVVTIVFVATNSPAERAGLVPGMQLTAIDDKPVKRTDDALALLRAAAPDAVVVLHVVDRDGDPTMRALRVPPT